MVFLINKYFCELPQDIKDMVETKTVYSILQQNNALDYRNFVETINDSEQKDALLPIEEIPVQDFSDVRIRKYVLAHFRKFDDKKGKPYLLDFINCEGEVTSLFLVGKNGYGKTSLYNGLEYIYTNNHISTMLQRKIDHEEDFLPYGEKTMDEIKIALELNEKEDNKNEEESYRIVDKPIVSNINFRSLFCCEYDILALHGNHDLTPYFLENLGLNDITNLLYQLKETENKLRPLDQNEENEDKLSFDMSSMQKDVFSLATNKSKIRRIDSLKRNFIPELKKTLNNKINSETDDIGKIIDWIRGFKGVLNANPDLNTLCFYNDKLSVINKYDKVIQLADKSKEAAYELYADLYPVERMAEDLYRYVFNLLSRFYDEKLNKLKTISTEMAVRQIEELIKEEENAQRRYLERKNRESTHIEPMYIQNLHKLRQALEEKYKCDKHELLKSCKETIEPLLYKFTHMSNDSTDDAKANEIIEIAQKEDGKLCAEIKNEEIFKHKTVTPEQFYNSFRYKLYCIAIKVVLAFMNMNLNKIKAPLIFDDVFTASDFDNTINIEVFFNSIFEAFKKIGLGGKKDIQIILFTHDEVVLNSISAIMENSRAGDESFNYISGILLDDKAIDGKEDLCHVPSFNHLFDKTGEAYIIYDKIRG